MKHNRILDTRSHGYALLFRDAVKATDRAIRKKRGAKAEIPLLSHALSDSDGMRWIVRDIAGNDIALVDAAGKAILLDDGR